MYISNILTKIKNNKALLIKILEYRQPIIQVSSVSSVG